MWKKPENFSNLETVIGPSVHLEGNFVSQGDVQVAGSLAGSLQTAGKVRVEEGARVHASIVAQSVWVGGEVRGDVKASDVLELAPTAKLAGNIEVKIFSMAAGAAFNGKCSMKGTASMKAVEPSKEGTKEVKA